MAVIASSGFAAAQVAAFIATFQYGCIEVYDGAQPASADAAPSGTLIARITADGGEWTAGSTTNGLRYVAAGRYVMKDAAQNWVLTGLATGTARSFRILPNAADPGTASTTSPRVDGIVGAVGAIGDVQMYIPTDAITDATSVNIPNWWYVVPPIGA